MKYAGVPASGLKARVLSHARLSYAIGMEELQKRQLISGSVLILIGIAMYLLKAQNHISYPALLVLLGTGFLGAYFYFRNYGYLVPGCVLLGFGSGNMWADSAFAFGKPTFIGMGAGFVGIYVIALAYERRTHWWPLIPGLILMAIGIGFQGGIEWLLQNWPLILVLVGTILVLSALIRPRTSK